VVLVLAFNGTFSGPRSGVAGLGGEAEPDSNAPPLAKLCPPPTGTHTPGYAEPEPPPPGKRTVDEKAGISYAAYGDPWQTWSDDWSGGDLKVHYRVGQHFVTETYSGGDYHASILSGSVPATVNDGTALDLKCTGKQVAADVRTSYYPEPNRPEKIRDEKTKLGGRDAWVTVFRLHFDEPGLKAKSELVGVVLMDVGRTEAAVLYVSIPGTHSQFDHVVDDVIESVRAVE
jgi:U5 snRNP spliceosome subunit